MDRIVESGGPELADKLEADGYEAFIARRGRMTTPDAKVAAGIGNDYKYGFHDPENYVFKSQRGLTKEVVEAISSHKSEPDWMRKFRLQSLEYFRARPLPTWGGNVAEIDFENIFYYIKPTEKQAKSWDDLPADIKDTLDKLGIPEAEKKFLAGVGAQYESEVVYHKLKEDLEKPGRDLPGHGLGRCASTRSWSSSTSARSSRRTTTSSPR